MDREERRPMHSDFKELTNYDESHEVKKEERSSRFSLLGLPRPWSKREKSPDGNRPSMSGLNLVLCGSDATLKACVLECFTGEKSLFTLHQTNFRSDCVKTEMHGRLVSLVELPALNHLSEEEVMRQTLRCVSLCHPGVHVFLLIVPVAPLTDEDKAEIEKIQKIFDSKEHFMMLFTTQSTVNRSLTNRITSNPSSQRLMSLCGGQYRVMGLKEPENSRQIPKLLQNIEKMKTEPYSLQTYVKTRENKVLHETEDKYKEELKRMESKIAKFQLEDAEADDQCLRIVLIGKTGNGKSATGNTILGIEEFHSQSNTDSVTTLCQKGVGEVDGRSVAVVDTPGIFDTKLTNEQAAEEIVKCVSLSSPGPHAFVIVLSVGRFTKEEAETVDQIKEIFGHEAAQFGIVLFTRRDELEDESIEDYLERCNNQELKKLIRDCGNRFLAFNNREKRDRTQVIQLLNMIEEVKNSNEGRYFTNSMFEEAEMSIKKRMEKIMKEREREIQTQHEALYHECEMEIQNLRKRLEDEKQRADKERKKIREEKYERDLEREQQRRKREIKEEMIQDFQRQEEELYLLKEKKEEEMKMWKRKYKEEVRRKAEENKKKTVLKLKNKLDEEYGLLEEWNEDEEEEGKPKKTKKRKNKLCVII